MERSGAISPQMADGGAAAHRNGRRPASKLHTPRPRRLVYLVALAMVLTMAGAEALQVGAWWAQFGSAFFGRRHQWDASDFACFYSAGKLVLHGHAHQILKPNALFGAQQASGVVLPGGNPLAYLSPPLMAAVMAPLAALSFDHAYQAWSMINLGVVVVCAWLLWRTASPIARPWRACLVVAFLTLYPLTYALRQGQFSVWLVAGAAGTYLSVREGHERAAGAWLSLLLLKPELLLPIAALLLWKRRYTVFTTLVPIALLWVVGSAAVVGTAEAIRYPQYLRHMSAGSASVSFTPEMFGWNGILSATLGVQRSRFALGVHIPLALASLASMALLWRGPWSVDDDRMSERWLALMLAGVLADPHLYIQDTIVLAPAAVAWVSSARPAGRAGEVLVAMLGWVVLGLGYVPNLTWQINLFGMAIAVALVGLIARGMWSSRKAADSERVTRDTVMLATTG